MYKTLGIKWLLEVFCPASAIATADSDEARNPQRFIHVPLTASLKEIATIQDITSKGYDMIRKRAEKDNDEIMNVWYKASSLAHRFLEADFVEKAKKDLRDVYIPNTDTWVYEENNSVIGFISMIGNEIGGLFVLPNNHFKGIGTRLVNFIKEFHVELEVEVFEKNAIGRAFYEKYGFVQIRKYYHKESNNDILRLHYKDEKPAYNSGS